MMVMMQAEWCDPHPRHITRNTDRVGMASESDRVRFIFCKDEFIMHRGIWMS